MMDIEQAKQQVKRAVREYFARDEAGMPRIPQGRQRPLFLLGAPGIGKTAIVEQVARELGCGLVSYSMTHHTRQSALGLPLIVERDYAGRAVETTEYTMSEIIASVYDCMERTGCDRGILFLDEINCVSETLYPSMLQFLQFKMFGRHRVPDGWAIVCAGNPPAYNRSVHEFDVVTLDRLRTIRVEPDLKAWEAFAREAGTHPAVLSYLEVRPEDFYHVESTPDGKRFVTARSWSDLSETIAVAEDVGDPVDADLIGQFLQDDEVAGRFSAYYELFATYRSDYQVPQILDGTASDEVRERARKAALDERLALLDLMVDAVSAQCADVLERERVTFAVRDALRQAKPLIEGGTSVHEAFAAATDPTRADEGAGSAAPAGGAPQASARGAAAGQTGGIPQASAGGFASASAGTHGATTGASGASSAEGDQRVQRLAHARLAAFAGACDRARQTAGPVAMEVVSQAYAQMVDALTADTDHARASIDHAYAFIDEVFGAGRESLVFTTELTARSAAAGFVNRFGSAGYFAHNKELLVDHARDDLMRQADDLASELGIE
jgi:DNA polymerase III delta prime subunit